MYYPEKEYKWKSNQLDTEQESITIIPYVIIFMILLGIIYFLINYLQ